MGYSVDSRVSYAGRFRGIWFQEHSLGYGGGPDLAIGVDRDGNPTIVYYYVRSDRHSYNEVYPAYQEDGQWVQGDVYQYPSYDYDRDEWAGPLRLAVDPNGLPHAVYYNPWDDAAGFPVYEIGLVHAWTDRSRWQHEIVTDEEPLGAPCLAFAPDGVPHLCYRTADQGLRYGVREDDAWHIETLSAVGANAVPVCLQVDGAGYPHLTTVDEATGTVMYLRRDSAGWHVEPVGNTSFVSADHRLAVDAQGMAHILFRDGRSGYLTYGAREADGWHFGVAIPQVLDALSDFGFAVDLDGTPHIAYYDASLGDLEYAYRVPASAQLVLPLLLR